jgi:hypothetical protein
LLFSNIHIGVAGSRALLQIVTLDVSSRNQYVFESTQTKIVVRLTRELLFA